MPSPVRWYGAKRTAQDVSYWGNSLRCRGLFTMRPRHLQLNHWHHSMTNVNHQPSFCYIIGRIFRRARCTGHFWLCCGLRWWWRWFGLCLVLRKVHSSHLQQESVASFFQDTPFNLKTSNSCPVIGHGQITFFCIQQFSFVVVSDYADFAGP